MPDKVVLSRREYLDRQIKKALEPENKWYAGEKFGHSPTDEEAVRHFAEAGGAKDFAEHYIPEEIASPEEKKT